MAITASCFDGVSGRVAVQIDGPRRRTAFGRVGNSGNSQAPHLHFQVMDAPSFFDATGLPFVFDAQLLEGGVSEAEAEGSRQGVALPIDRTGAGVRRGQMPARNGVFGYNLSLSQ